MTDTFTNEPGTIINFDGGMMDVIHDGSMDIASIDGEVVSSEKATEVDYDPKTGEWFSELRDGREICRNSDRAQLVIDEHGILAEMLSRGERIPKNNWRSTLIRDARRWIRKHFRNERTLRNGPDNGPTHP